MKRTCASIPLGDYAALQPDAALAGARKYVASKVGRDALALAMADGCRLLQAIWQSAWAMVGAQAAGLVEVLDPSDCASVYAPPEFLPSATIDCLSVEGGHLVVAIPGSAAAPSKPVRSRRAAPTKAAAGTRSGAAGRAGSHAAPGWRWQARGPARPAVATPRRTRPGRPAAVPRGRT